MSDGTAANGYSPSFPFAEVYTDGVWNPVLLPLPPDAGDPTHQYASLSSVSCGSDGSCAAVGIYNPTTPAGCECGLMEQLTGGVWTATSAPSPDGQTGDGGILVSVSCVASGTCIAVGFGAPDGSAVGALYTLDAGVWQAQVAPVPADADDLTLTGVSCADDGDCVAVGFYQYFDASVGGDPTVGLIFTLASGAWTYASAPVPQNAAVGQVDLGPFGYYQNSTLNAVDCPTLGACVIGGFYIDTSGNIDPLIIEQQSDHWIPEQGPLPPDAELDPPNTSSQITSVSCATAGNCVASGWYTTDWVNSQFSGLLLSQNGPGDWSAASAPVPASLVNAVNFRTQPRSVAPQATATQATAKLTGVSCVGQHACVAVGVGGGSGFIDAADLTTKALAPVVTSVSPRAGPLTGGNTVTITGAYLSGATQVMFGSKLATNVKVVRMTRITAIAPARSAGAVAVRVVAPGGASTWSTARYSYDAFQISSSDTMLHAAHGRHVVFPLTTVGAVVGAAVAWTAASALPAFLTLSHGGVLSGTPPNAGTYGIDIRASETIGHKSTSATKVITLVVK